MDSKVYSWKWVTQDELLSHGPCELLHAHLIASGSESAAVDIYDGESTTGDKIVTLKSVNRVNAPFLPPKPIYCRRGLYLDLTSSAEGVFVQWRELGSKG